MANIAPKIRFPGLLYDALSGEFHPPQEPMWRAHTLGRLAYAATTKGRLTVGPTGVIEAGRFNAFYNPSWAPSVDVDVHGAMTDDIASVETLFLATPDADELVIAMDSETTVTVDDTPYELELGQKLSIARAAITTATQDFFRRATLETS